MKKSKGFTLVELLAVIVILAVLVLLAVPNVLKMMDNARKGAFETEVARYLEGAETAYVVSQMDGTAQRHFTRTGSGNSYTESPAAELDAALAIKHKSGYVYNICIIPGTNGTLTFTYAISNGTYMASGSSVARTATITATGHAADTYTDNATAATTACNNNI